MQEIVYLIIFSILSLLFAIAALVASVLCSYKNASDEKSETYECGMKLFSDGKIQFDVKFFNYAILFLIFDVETVFLFPFAVSFNKLGLFAVVETFVFVGLLLFALAYCINRNMLGINK